MNKLILTLLLAVVSNSAMAKWVKLGVDDGGSTMYFNSSSIHKKGNIARMWTLSDYKDAQLDGDDGSGDEFLSTRTQMEFNCEEEKTRILALINSSGNMGTGKTVFNSTLSSDWQAIPPETLGEQIMKIACGKIPPWSMPK